MSIPLLTLLLVLPIFLVMMFFLTQTPLGRWIYAIGGNEKAARLVGLPVNTIRLGVYGLSGILAALAGLGADSRLVNAPANIWDNPELFALSPTPLGGTRIFERARAVA